MEEQVKRQSAKGKWQNSKQIKSQNVKGKAAQGTTVIQKR